MTPFVEKVVARAGLGPLLAARRANDIDAVRASLASWRGADLLALGAIADAARAADVGDVVRIHPSEEDAGVGWIERRGTDLEVLRDVAIARIARGGRVGVDWSAIGLELAQVALGFGASDLRGPITKKSGLPVLEHEARKIKGEGMVGLASIKRQEIAVLVAQAGRVASFVDPLPRTLLEPIHA